MSSRILLSAACAICLQLSCLVQEVQPRAEALLNHARQLTDIRSPGSPAFHLTATFSFVGKDLDTVEGTYTEVWVSGSQWRREIAIGDMHHVEVGGPGKYWILFPDGFPQQADQLLPLLAVFPSISPKNDFASVSEHSNNGLVVDCAYTKPVMLNLPASFCFEKNSGLLLEEVRPKKRPQNIIRYSCGFRTFHKFGNHLFPYDLDCFADRHKAITVVVNDLSPEPSSDPALFIPPSGAAEVAECSGKIEPPRQKSWGLMRPRYDQIEEPVPLIKVWFVVDAKGKTQDIKVMDVARNRSVNDLLEIIQTWRYSPGTCDGKPVAMALSPELPEVMQPH